MKICLLYQSLLGIYGDRGNALVLRQRLLWRQLPAELIEIEPGDSIPPDADIYLLGGGEDAAQISAVNFLRADGNLHRAVADGAVLFAVCAGYQITGRSFTVGDDDRVVEGLGLLDVETRRGNERAVGEILTRWTPDTFENSAIDAAQDDAASLITGFENHGGFTYLDPQVQALAQVEIGIGNNGDGTEGAVQGRVIGTYPHGPVLARNAALADHLLNLARERHNLSPLEPLPDTEINELHRQRVAFVRKHGLRQKNRR